MYCQCACDKRTYTYVDLCCRIEDTDQARSTAESEAAVLQDLKWMGIKWDEGMSTAEELIRIGC